MISFTRSAARLGQARPPWGGGGGRGWWARWISIGLEHVQLQLGLVGHARRVPRRIEHQVDARRSGCSSICSTASLTQPGISPATGQPGAVRVMSMTTSLVVGDVDPVDQAELVDVDRDLGVEDASSASRPGRRSAGPALPAERADCSAALGTRLASSIVVQLKKAPGLERAPRPRRRRPPGLLYRAKEARALDVTPKRRSRGSAQWVPARTATP